MTNKIRTRDTQIHNLATELPNALKGNDLRQSSRDVAHHLPTDTCQNDQDLGDVVAAWPDLPEAIQAGIMSMVKAASASKDSGR
jgi:hypothetical protein